MSTHIKNRAIYRIYTEDKNINDTIKLLGDYFTNFSVFHGACLWHGKRELTVVFEIVDDGQRDNLKESVNAACQAILTLNYQSDILVTESKVNIAFINIEGSL